MRVVESVVELIGRTPMVRLGALKEPGEADVFAKLEYLNPGMSVKDRTALGLIRDAEERGLLKPGGTILEATAGNTGVGLALVGVARGYRVVIVMIEGYAREKMVLIRGLGGEVVLVPHGSGIPGARAKVEELAAEIPNAVPMRQFESAANPRIHYETTGPEVWEQLEGRVDGLAVGVGTGGTFTGVARFLKEKDTSIACWGVEPPDSIYGGGDGTGVHMVEGIGNAFFPATFDRSLADGIFTVPHAESYAMVDALGRAGLPAGASSGAALAGAKRLARVLGEGKRVVTLLTDPSERYFSKYVYDRRYEGRPIP